MNQHGKVFELLKHFEAMGIPSIDCIVYHRGKCVFRHLAGFSDEAKRKPTDGNELYNLYSCSKLITCTAALQLVETGDLQLDAPVGDYLPEFRRLTKRVGERIEPVRNTMTVRHLFTMTAGLTYAVDTDNLKRGRAETDGEMPTREAMKYLAQDPLAFEPGEGWRYSLCHDVLAAIVEVVSRQRFGEYVEKHIFAPLGMKRSTFLLPDERLPEIAAQYSWREEERKFVPIGPRITPYKLGRAYESGGAGCVSTVEEYITFLENLRSGEALLRRDTVAMMSSPQIPPEFTTAAKTVPLRQFMIEGYSYGLGVRCPKPGVDKPDFGWGGAAGSYLAILPEAEATIFYAQHVRNSPNRTLRIQLPTALVEDLRS
ncbi:MAG: beta-lactamase family protein [Lentisphaeria bacterium]|nr:beta-lactamase family protein [Lentisphaeria bacterium]